jgi:hypothetical protein
MNINNSFIYLIRVVKSKFKKLNFCVVFTSHYLIMQTINEPSMPALPPVPFAQKTILLQTEVKISPRNLEELKQVEDRFAKLGFRNEWRNYDLPEDTSSTTGADGSD